MLFSVRSPSYGVHKNNKFLIDYAFESSVVCYHAAGEDQHRLSLSARIIAQYVSRLWSHHWVGEYALSRALNRLYSFDCSVFTQAFQLVQPSPTARHAAGSYIEFISIISRRVSTRHHIVSLLICRWDRIIITAWLSSIFNVPCVPRFRKPASIWNTMS